MGGRLSRGGGGNFQGEGVHADPYNLYIYFACLSVCLFLFNKRQNG